MRASHDEMNQKFEPGQQVVIDKNFAFGGGIVEVVSQTPCRLFTTVKDESETWDVMTCRLKENERGNRRKD